MKKKLLAATALAALLNLPSLGAGADEPILQLRLRMPDTQSDATWASTFGIIRENPGCCDEVWFSTGIPLNVGVGRVEGNVSGEELETDYHQETTLRIQDLRDALDRRIGGSPAVLESPFVGHMMPRVSSDGTVRLVALLSVRIEEQGPLTIRLRHVPAGLESVTWREMNRAPVVLPLVRTGNVVRVTVPSLSAWNAGWLKVGERQ